MNGGGLEPAAADLLVFEPDWRGHVAEWLDHIADYLRHHASAPRVTFVVSENSAAALRRTRAVGIGSLRIESLSPREQALCTHRSLLISGFARWFVMCRWLRRVGADHGIFLGADLTSLALALQLPGAGGRTLSGILFRPSVHYQQLGSGAARLSERVRDLRKRLLYPLMLRHRALTRLHSLDPYFPAFARSAYPYGAKVTVLPDPVATVEPPKPADLEPLCQVPPGRTTFVLFGVLTERKGVMALLKALALLDDATAERTAVIMAGQLDAAIRDAALQQFATLARERPALSLHLEDRHLSTGQLTRLVCQADIVLAPYQRFVGSSGVLIWAARIGRPVLTQTYGLLGHLVREYRLGLAVDCNEPLQLADAMRRMTAHHADRLADAAGQAAFLAGRTPEDFACSVIGMTTIASQNRHSQAPETADSSGPRNDHNPSRHEHV